MFKILLDPGHYNGQNPYGGKWGAQGITEAGQMWKLANFLKTYIEANYADVKVDLTKPSQAVEVSLERRGAMAAGYDLFLSLHTNAWTIETRGTQMYYAAGDHDGSSRRLAAFLADLIGDEVFGHADAVSKAVLRLYPSTTNVSYYGVLRAAERTNVKEAIMAELGFHTNDLDLEIIATDAGLQLISKVMSQGLAGWYKWQAKSGGGSGADQAYASYLVKPGDNPWDIAVAMLGDGMRFREIVSINGLREPYMIYAGQKLLLPPDSVKPAPTPDVKQIKLSKGTPIFRESPIARIDQAGVYTSVEEKDGSLKLKSGIGFVSMGDAK